MKKLLEQTKARIKGASTAALISIGIHVAVLLVAGSWVVVTKVAPWAEAIFTPPPQVERPKMDLKKLRVKIKESSKPRKETERIVSSSTRSSMPDIKLPPPVSGGDAAGSILKGMGSKGFNMMGDLSTMSIMGSKSSISAGNDLVGTFYDFKRDRSGAPVPGMIVADGAVDCTPFNEAINKFLANNWSPKTLDRFYKGPIKLYATQFMIPCCSSYIAPPKFGIGEDIQSCLWGVHYKGKIASKTGGKFRFWGFGDDVLFVRINGKVVLNASHNDRYNIKDPGNWKSSAPEDRKYILGNAWARVGDWFTMEPGAPVDMEVFFAEGPGGMFTFMLMVQEDGVVYPKNEQGAPILPMFKTMKTPAHLIDEIKYTLVPNQVDLEGGPIFSAY